MEVPTSADHQSMGYDGFAGLSTNCLCIKKKINQVFFIVDISFGIILHPVLDALLLGGFPLLLFFSFKPPYDE